MNKPKILIFDFDGTLTTDTWPKFWVWVKKFGYNGNFRNKELEKAISDYRKIHKDEDAWHTFFGFFNDLLVSSKESLSTQELLEGEKFIEYNPGAELFLQYANSSPNIKTYILSSGLKEFLQGLVVSQYFDSIYGSSVIFDDNKRITGIDMNNIMSDKKKIQAIQNILAENDMIENDCSNVIYVGDGDSDGPSMKFVHENGGKCIFVYQTAQKENVTDVIQKMYGHYDSEGTVDFIYEADYRPGSSLRNKFEELIEDYPRSFDNRSKLDDIYDGRKN